MMMLKMPGRTMVTKLIDELYEDMMFKLKDMLKQSSSVSLTTDAANMPNRAFGECVKSFQYFVFIGCTKSSVIRYYNTCVY